jgi:glucose-1-phosphate thymidylyltransferase
VKGIILAGGSGTRLAPVTSVVNKHFLPIYDKPLIYYPLANLMLAKIKEIAIISSPDQLPLFKRLLGDGSRLNLSLSYYEQEKPRGIAEAFLICERFIGDSSVALALGDNIFFGDEFSAILHESTQITDGARVFAYRVRDPQSYGVVEFDKNNRAISLEEKPKHPKSFYAIPGIYFYDNTVIAKAKAVKPSDRGELEITTINEMYLKEDKLFVNKLGRGVAWLDTGTHDSLSEANTFVSILEKRTGLKLACIEEVAYRSGLINLKELAAIAESMPNNTYTKYIRDLVVEERELLAHQ